MIVSKPVSGLVILINKKIAGDQRINDAQKKLREDFGIK